MEAVKKILRTPSALVLFLVAVVSLIGVIIKSQSDIAIARIPVEATSTAEARLTETAKILAIRSPLPTFTNPAPISSPASETDLTSLGTPGTYIIPISGPTNTNMTQPNLVSVVYQVDRKATPPNGFVLPDNIQPVLSSTLIQASNEMGDAFGDWAFPFWSNAPGEYPSWSVTSGKMASHLSVAFDITNTNLDVAWVKVHSTIQVSIVKDSVPESVQLVTIIDPSTPMITEEPPTSETTSVLIPITGDGYWHLASEEILLSSEDKNSNFNIHFPDADFYTLQPGEFESFKFKIMCKLPGIYHLILEIPYTYLTDSNVLKYSGIPPIVCPEKATYWAWWWGDGFYSKHEYSWDGKDYTP